MGYKIFTVRLPAEMVERLDEESREEFRKQNARNQMIIKILSDRYKKAPDSTEPNEQQGRQLYQEAANH